MYVEIKVLKGIPVEKKKAMAIDIAKVLTGGGMIPVEMAAKELVFIDIPPENFSPVEEITADNLPVPIKHITIHAIGGRTLEQKRELFKNIAEAVAKNLGIPADSEEIVVDMIECSPENVSHGGILTKDKGPLQWAEEHKSA